MPLNDGTQTRKVRVKQGREWVTKTIRIKPIDPGKLKVTMDTVEAPKPEATPSK